MAKEIFEQEDTPTNVRIGSLLMKQKGPQVNTLGGTTILLVMRLVY